MCNIPDHPVIRNLEQTGYPDGRKDDEQPICPVCGRETDTYYKQDGEIIGCGECIRRIDAWEVA